MVKRRGRYIGIFRGGKEDEINKTIAFLRGTNKAEYPSRRGNRPPSLLVYCEPWSANFAANSKLVQKVNQQRWQSVSNFVAAFTSTAAPAAVLDIDGLLAPRAVITYGRSNAQGAMTPSQITGRNYRKGSGTAVVVPFGKGANGATPGAAFTKIKDNATTADPLNQVVYVPGSVGF